MHWHNRVYHHIHYCVALWLYSVNCMHWHNRVYHHIHYCVALWLYSVNCMHWHNRVYHHIHYSSHYGCIVSTVCTGTTEYIIHPLLVYSVTVCTGTLSHPLLVALWLYSVNSMHWHNRVYHHIHYCVALWLYSVNSMHWQPIEYIITSITCRTMAV